jgi:uncharacterized lipoprotein YmbA
MALAALVTLAACGTPTPAPPLLYLPSAPASHASVTSSGGLPASTLGNPGTAGTDWRLASPVGLPAALDREAVMVAIAPGQWVPWQGLRWAEPLRDSLPRVLRADLTDLLAARGQALSIGPAAPGAPPARLLQVDVGEWEASLATQQVALQARWSLSPGPAGEPPLRGQLSLRETWSQPTAQGLVQAQRTLLRQLAQGIVAGAIARPSAP